MTPEEKARQQIDGQAGWHVGLDLEADPIQRAAIQKVSGGKAVSDLSAAVLNSIDPDANVEAASRRFLPRPVHPLHGIDLGYFEPNRPYRIPRRESPSLASRGSNLLRHLSDRR
jgi:hypothetical protein